MEFKGTKGKWRYRLGEDNNIVFSETYGGILNCHHQGCAKEEHDYNAVLISKAPEMLERLKEQNIDLKILKNNLSNISEVNHLVIGYSDVVQNWIESNEQLIKEATTI